MSLTASEWHARFTQQARWTRDLRQHLFQRAGLDSARRVLEVGCGTGAVLGATENHTEAALHGLDIELSYLNLLKDYAPGSHPTCGDAHRLPYADRSFDLASCHFLLLWVADPLAVLREMARVARPGCPVMALAEPDYGGRIDHPQELAPLGEWQRVALEQQGADPLQGRKLASLFHQAGLEQVETGVLGGQWQGAPSPEERSLEWDVLEADLAAQAGPETLDRLRRLDEAAWKRGARVLFVPTFYAWGRVGKT